LQPQRRGYVDQPCPFRGLPPRDAILYPAIVECRIDQLVTRSLNYRRRRKPLLEDQRSQEQKSKARTRKSRTRPQNLLQRPRPRTMQTRI
jgi:hypothetical protein